MAALLCWVRLLPLLVLLTFSPGHNFVFITDEEAALLAEAAQNISCFSRTFEDLICFWDEPADAKQSYRFFYTYKGGEKRECTLTSVGHVDGGLRHACNFSNDHHSIKLFSELSIEVLEVISNHTTRTQKLLVETVGLIAPPTNVTAEWLGVAQQLHVMWIPPPIAYANFLAYEVLYHIESSRDLPSMVEVKESHTCYIRDLLPGQKYHIRVRTKPDGTSLDGFWGPWSPEVLAEIPHLPGSTIFLNVEIVLLLCTGLMLGLGCIGLPIYSTVKEKIWPPIPDLHNVLDGVLDDNGKQQQVNPFFCNKTLEDTPLTCLLEVLSERPVETQSYGPLFESISERAIYYASLNGPEPVAFGERAPSN
ncbi:thrombopoietin receptor isoform X2 [Sceloporus undulatus]|uniref:thrombopoietin receptor isoform X2 n=1 Tax=Sceloporus undulatus TaxID=8520 RepID=UPI001C4BE693|nr:thrombopoietin receptor isoform X2 [Sceloporus undulatus]